MRKPQRRKALGFRLVPAIGFELMTYRLQGDPHSVRRNPQLSCNLLIYLD